jgi:hypothetical protein
VAGREIHEQNGVVQGKTNYKWEIFHCHVGLPEGISDLDIFGYGGYDMR